jgi:transposase-like protein
MMSFLSLNEVCRHQRDHAGLCEKFSQSFGNSMRRHRPRPGDKGYLDAVSIRMQGVQHYLWRAADQDGVILEILLLGRREAAKRFVRRLLMGLQYVPRVIVTDKLRSYGVTQRHLLPDRRAPTKPISHIGRHDAENSRCNGSSYPRKPRTLSQV